jgi:hypothetical protein
MPRARRHSTSKPAGCARAYAAHAGGLLPLSSRSTRTAGDCRGVVLRSGRCRRRPSARSDLEADDLQIAGPWPSRDGQGTCFVNPWSWAVVARPSAPEPLTIELATWLALPEFTGPWTHALNLLPASESALAGWPEDGKRSLAGLLGTACLPLPSPDDLALFGPVLRDAAGAALTGELTPEVAARLASAALARP